MWDVDPATYADEHEGGQLRIACAGEQVPLLALPDSAIPTTDALQAVDEVERVRVLGSDAAVAVGRFDVDGPNGYRAKSGGPVRATRAEAEADELDALDEAIREQTGTHPADPTPEEQAENDGPDFAELHRQRVEGHTGRRERLERKAEKRREWADSRTAKANAATSSGMARLDAIPFGQPVHGVRDRNYREKARRALDRGHEHGKMAREHEQKADGLESQIRGAIYSDDVDAVERLEEKLARLEQQREAMKARNAAYRKDHRAELKTMSPYERSQAVPHASYELQNLGGNITRTRERLEQLKRAAVVVAQGGRGRGRPMVSRFASSCADCDGTIEKGEEIVYYKLTREAVHAACDTKREG